LGLNAATEDVAGVDPLAADNGRGDGLEVVDEG